MGFSRGTRAPFCEWVQAMSKGQTMMVIGSLSFHQLYRALRPLRFTSPGIRLASNNLSRAEMTAEGSIRY